MYQAKLVGASVVTTRHSEQYSHKELPMWPPSADSRNPEGGTHTELVKNNVDSEIIIE